MTSMLRALGLVALMIGLYSCSSDVEEFEGDEPGECEDRADNDRDGAFDCDDDGCSGSPSCSGGDGDADADVDAETDTDCRTETDADIDCEFEGWNRWEPVDGGNCHFYLPVSVPERISWHNAVELIAEHN